MRRVPILRCPACVIARTRDWIAIDKPSGLPSRPAPGHESSALRQLEAWLGPETRPGVVHRLDRDTSGLLLFSLAPRASRALVAAFRAHDPKRVLAWVEGAPRPRRGTIDLALTRGSSGRVVVDARGRAPLTRYETLRRRGRFSESPAWSRPRDACTSSACTSPPGGTPIAGDRIYGSGRRRHPRLLLHAGRLPLPAVIGELDARDEEEGSIRAVVRDSSGRVVPRARPPDFDAPRRLGRRRAHIGSWLAASCGEALMKARLLDNSGGRWR
ncbi:MAG: RNA pseudouridine synthase [Candidatus Eisenbacteria bacterium]